MPHVATLAVVGLGEPASGSKAADAWQALLTVNNYGQNGRYIEVNSSLLQWTSKEAGKMDG